VIDLRVLILDSIQELPAFLASDQEVANAVYDAISEHVGAYQEKLLLQLQECRHRLKEQERTNAILSAMVEEGELGENVRESIEQWKRNAQ
jgi:hypothetical protein